MIIRHADLETCTKNPKAWVVKKLSPLPSFTRTGYAGVTKLAIYRFHRDLDANAACLHLSNLLPKFGLTNQSLTDQTLADLISYIAWFQNTSPIVAAFRHRLRFGLGAGCFLGGEVSRIDVDPSSDRYHAIILGDSPPKWQSEMRFPLIQRALSQQLKRKDTLISVGFQCLDGSGIMLKSFPKKMIDNAEIQARHLASAVTKEWHLQGGQ